MASLNPFDLLGDDAEDPSQLAVALSQKVEKAAAAVQPPKAAKFPTKPAPPSQAVRESRNAPQGGRGGTGGRGGFSRGRGNGGYNRDNRNNDAPGNENGFSGGYRRPSEDADGASRGGSVGGYRVGGGREGPRRGGVANGESGDVERPPRNYDRHSRTGHGTGMKRNGGGRGNWGTTEDDIPPTSEEPTTEVEKSPVAEKQGGEDETPEAKKELTAEEKAQKEAEEAEARVQSFTALETSFEEMTLEEYEKILEEKKKALQATKVEERKVDTKVFESMQQLSNKKNTDEEIFIKLGSDKEKRKDATEKAKKVLVHSVEAPAEEEVAVVVVKEETKGMQKKLQLRRLETQLSSLRWASKDPWSFSLAISVFRFSLVEFC
ncbi:putative hyaluronan/mRNA-binding protein [Arabidopsis thaliana]